MGRVMIRGMTAGEHALTPHTSAMLHPSLIEKIKEVVLTSDQTTQDLTDLNINTDKAYVLYLNLKNPVDAANFYIIYVEGDYTDINYYRQNLEIDGITVSASRDNNPNFMYVTNLQCVAGVYDIFRDPNGYVRIVGHNVRGAAASSILAFSSVVKTATVANLTSIRIKSYQTGGIGAGSVIQLCRPVPVT